MGHLCYHSDLDPLRTLTFPILFISDNGGREILLAVPSVDYEENGREMHIAVDKERKTARLVKDESILSEEDNHRILVGTNATLIP